VLHSDRSVLIKRLQYGIVVNLLFSIGLAGCGPIRITFGFPNTPTQTNPPNLVTIPQAATETNTLTIEISSPTTESIPVESTPQVRPILPANQLSQAGPWLIYATSDGIEASNPDGSGSALVSPRLLSFFAYEESDVPEGISPNGTMFAHRIDNAGGNGYDLELIHFPSLEREIITPLISADNLAKMKTDITADQNVGSAVIYDGSIAWSPDGRYLAFSAALDGPSSDLYVYDSSAKKIHHLTYGALEVALPRWTPDSKEIIYQVVETFGTGAGWSTRGLWAIHVDGSSERRIFTAPEDSGPDVIEGFYNDKMLVRHFTMGGDSLYLADWKTGDTTLLIPDVRSAAIEPINGSYLFINSAGTLYFSPDTETIFGPISKYLFSDGTVYWQDVPGRFLVLAEGFVEVDQFGNVSDLQGIPFTAEDWASTCVVTTGIDCTTLSDSFSIPDVKNPVLYWVPDASGFFYLSNGQLFYVSTSDHIPVGIDRGVLTSNTQLPVELGWLRKP
jgi:hypothetical protein